MKLDGKVWLVAATLGTIVERLRERELPLPVVFIIGEHAVPEGVGKKMIGRIGEITMNSHE